MASRSIESRGPHRPDQSELRSLYCSALDGFFRSFRATRFFTTNTQGSAKPPPWAKFLYAFRLRHSSTIVRDIGRSFVGQVGVLHVLVLSLPTGVCYLMHFPPITSVAACRAVPFCSSILAAFCFPSHEISEGNRFSNKGPRILQRLATDAFRV
jgi:hypothetical protein